MALKLIRFTPYKDAAEIYHIFVGQRWEEPLPGSKYFKELFLDTLCARSTHSIDARAKIAKFEFAQYDRKLHGKNMCKDCVKKLKASLPVPTRKLRSFHE